MGRMSRCIVGTLIGFAMAGCQMSMTGSYDPREWNPSLATTWGLETVDRDRKRPEQMAPIDVSIGEIKVSASEQNLVFDPEELFKELRSRISSSILHFDHFGTISDRPRENGLRVEVELTKLLWDRNERSIQNLYSGSQDIQQGENVVNSWIECEIEIRFVDASGATVAAASGLGVKAAQSGVRVIEATGDGMTGTRVEGLRSEPVSEIDIPDAIRLALDAAVALAIPRLERYATTHRHPASSGAS